MNTIITSVQETREGGYYFTLDNGNEYFMDNGEIYVHSYRDMPPNLAVDFIVSGEAPTDFISLLTTAAREHGAQVVVQHGPNWPDDLDDFIVIVDVTPDDEGWLFTGRIWSGRRDSFWLWSHGQGLDLLKQDWVLLPQRLGWDTFQFAPGVERDVGQRFVIMLEQITGADVVASPITQHKRIRN